MLIESTNEMTSQRLDRFLANRENVTRAVARASIEAGYISVNSEVVRSPRFQIRDGDTVEVNDIKNKKSSDLKPQPADFDILYEDAEILVINKPAGLAVHPGPGEMDPHPTVASALKQRFGSGLCSAESLRCGIVHRLDVDTTGVMVCAKTDAAAENLMEQFREKNAAERRYIAICVGNFPICTTNQASYLARDLHNRRRRRSFALSREDLPPDARLAETDFEKLSESNGYSVVQARLKTGRTHQIRVHAKDLGFPILGDRLYGGNLEASHQLPTAVRETIAALSRQMLHAFWLKITHPKTGESMTFQAPIPPDFAEVFESLNLRWP